jgi:hypothetical protein
MPIDTSIYNALIRPKSVADYTAEYDERDIREQRRQVNALALQAGQQKADEYGRGLREQEAVRNALAALGGTATDEQRIGALYGTGTGYGMTQAEALRKQMVEQAKTAAQAAKDRADAAKSNGALLKQYSTILTQSPTQATAMALLNHYESTTGERADEIRGVLQRAGDNPDVLRQIAFALSTEGDKLLPKTQTVDVGNARVQQVVNPVTGVATETGRTPIMQSPDSVASNAVTMRGQDMVDARSREANSASVVNGRIPPGYRMRADGNLEAIPGGPADIKSGADGARAEQKKASIIAQSNSVLDTVSDAKNLVSMNTAGVGSWLSVLPATDARNLAAKLETVKANLGFDRLQQMRDQSPTGGALGAVAVQELTALQSTVASLDQAQSPTELTAALDKIEGHYKRWLEVMGAPRKSPKLKTEDLYRDADRIIMEGR